MVELRDSFSKLVEETLAIEDPRLKVSQSQRYSSDNEEDNTMTTEDSTEEVLEKSQDFCQ